MIAETVICHGLIPLRVLAEKLMKIIHELMRGLAMSSVYPVADLRFFHDENFF